jgi:hypothetical protein
MQQPSPAPAPIERRLAKAAAAAPLAGAAIVIALAIVQAAFSQALYGDGAWLALYVIEHGSWMLVDPARLHAQWLNQAPLVLAVRSGIHDTHALTMLYTLGQVAVPAAAYALALAYARRTHLLTAGILVAIAIAYLNAGFVSHGEYVWAYAIATLVFAILLRDEPLRTRDAVVLVACGALALRVYEAFVYFGPLAFALALVRLSTDSPRSQLRVQALVALFAFLAAAAAAISLWAIWFPRDPNNAAGALALGPVLRNAQLLVTLGAAAALAVSALARGRALATASVGIALACALAIAFVPPVWALPIQHYLARTFAGMCLFALFTGLALLRFAPRAGAFAWTPAWSGQRAPLAAASLALVAALAVPFAAKSLGWNAFIAEYRDLVNSRRGVVALEDTPLVREGRREYVWWWTNPSLSHLLGDGPEHAVIRNEIGWTGWQPFDPSVPRAAMLPYSWK